VVTVGAAMTVTVSAQDGFGNNVGTTVTLNVTGGLSASPNSVSVVGRSASVTATLAAGQVGTWSQAQTVTLTASAGGVSSPGVKITVNPDWFSENISDPALQNLARTDFNRDGSLTYNDWLGLFTAAETENPNTVSSAEYASLNTLATSAHMNMAPNVADLAAKVTGQDVGNGQYNYLQSNGTVASSPLGNLSANCPTWALEELVNKWFLGVDYPTTLVSSTAYQKVTGVQLFQTNQSDPNEPVESASLVNYYDVSQGGLADCWLLASAAEAAFRDPSAIWNMFTDNHNGTYTVRFYSPSGQADYVTVDTELPGGGTLYDLITHTDLQPYGASFFTNQANQPASAPAQTTELWVALLEKAYSQENVEGFLASNNPGVNSYQALNVIFSTANDWGTQNILQALTNKTASEPSLTSSNMQTAWQKKQMIVLGTTDLPTGATTPVFLTLNNGATSIVSGHVYAVVGYNATTQQYLLFNPWGLNGLYEPLANNNSAFCSGLVSLTVAQMTGRAVVQTTSGPQTVSPIFWFETTAGSAAVPNRPPEPTAQCAAVLTPVDRLAVLDAAFASGTLVDEHHPRRPELCHDTREMTDALFAQQNCDLCLAPAGNSGL
jgi:hypothetical protein